MMDNMDPTLSELGDEFTLGDIDGKEARPNPHIHFNPKALSDRLGVYEASLIGWVVNNRLLFIKGCKDDFR